MSQELSKVYDPKAVEPVIYRRWLEAGAFAAEPDVAGPKYCVVIPPPNVTAPLHLGHALNNTLQDVLIRWRRMQGYNTLWMPGTDHAGIATQTVVEKRILAEEGRRRTDFERDEFVRRVQQWKDQYEARIIEQLKLMGCSCDWRRTRFTMDEVCARAVRECFFRLFEDGLIYRGKRLVNWDPATQTVLADDEVEYETVQGHFWYLRYPLLEPVQFEGRTIEYVTVATTRPETMLGDTAVAVNPADPRAGVLVGRKVRLPIVGRIIPIIADEHVVLPDPDSDDDKARYSTGFLKVTPAHDPDDYQIGQRHDLPMINVLAPDGTISDKHGWEDWEQIKNGDVENLIGMDRFEAREAVVEFFRQRNLLEEVREYTHEVGHSYRSHVPIEPYLSDQWYIAVRKPIERLAGKFGRGTIEGTDIPVNSLAGLALKPLLDGRVKFTPDRYANTYRNWLENLRDWPISRQLWWGHRIPVWSKRGDCSGNLPEGTCRISSQDDQGPVTYACPPPGVDEAQRQLERDGWAQDDDVLDTWFSSALWPFSTLGWPEQTAELKTFYPGDVLCTAREIITLWVSRMVMMGQYCCGDVPFRDVFIHAMIQDGQGRKMSKSLGNGIDPLDIINSHGADAMRFTLVSMTTQTQDVRMPVEQVTLPDGRKVNTSPKFDIGRNFCNKLWNAARFVMMNIAGAPPWDRIDPTARTADAWILSRLNATVAKATDALEAFRFSELAELLYHFTWDDFCDWYVEIAKTRINAGAAEPKAILAHCLDTILRLLHPIEPFITEAIWSRLNDVLPQRGPAASQAEPLLVRASWPRPQSELIDERIEQRFRLLQDLIGQVRSARKEHNIPPRRRIDAICQTDQASQELITRNTDLLAALASLGQVQVCCEQVEQPSDAAVVSAGATKLFLLGMIDRKAELARLNRQAETLREGIRRIQAKLDNEAFLSKAPARIVQQQRDRLGQMQAQLEAVNQALQALSD